MFPVRIPDPSTGRINAVFAIGFTPIILTSEQDANQMWLPFVTALLVQPRRASTNVDASANQPPKPPNGETLAARWEHKKLESKRRLVDYEKGIHQQVLPFHEHKAISNKEWMRLKEADVPAFERRLDGSLYAIEFFGEKMLTNQQVNSFKEWCRENCQGRFHINRNHAIFENSKDAVAARLFL